MEAVHQRFPGDDGRAARISLIDEGGERKVRMANLAIVGSHSTNGVAAIHSDLLRRVTVSDLAAMFPERFNNKTNGVTPRRWLLMANPLLAGAVTKAIGEGWMTNLDQLRNLTPLADDGEFQASIGHAKRAAKIRFADWLKSTSGQTVDPDTIFDCQVKRIHEYKRQLLNALRIIVLYDRIRANPELATTPRTFLFAGKAAPAYRLAKLIIKFINNLAETIDRDPAMTGRLKVVFLPEYCVSLAERLIPASDVSNQISTAGYEASGTSNMKFMMNGALTLGTRDGATIEMAEEAGEENFFLFGLTAEQVAGSRGWYSPQWRSFQPRGAWPLCPAARCPSQERRPLHASGRSLRLSRCGPAALRTLCQSRRVAAQGHSQYCGIGQVLQRPHDRGIRHPYLECQTLSGELNTHRDASTPCGGPPCQSRSAPARAPTNWEER
jgi:starch phosphorylase